MTSEAQGLQGWEPVQGNIANDFQVFKDKLDSLERSLDIEILDAALRRFVHSSRGMELAPFLVVRALSHLQPRYSLYYRCHAWLLALGATPEAIRRAVTVTSPIGPMQPRLPGLPVDFISVTVGSQLPVALGLALGRKGPTVAALGDGALSTGVVFETLNAAAIHRPDLLFVIDDNNRVVTSVGGKVIQADPALLAQALGLEHLTVAGEDLADLQRGVEWVQGTTGTVRILHVRTQPSDPHCLAAAPTSRGAA